MKITEIKVASPFKDLFEIKEKDLEAIKSHMSEHEYDPSHPIVIWKEKGVIVDGHTRFQAAKALYEKDRKLVRNRTGRFDDIPVIEHSFKTEEEALQHAIHNQTERRNLSEWDILMLVEKMDERLPRGGDRKSEEARDRSKFGNPKLDSRERTADIVGISKDKVSQCRYILENCYQKTLDSIHEGRITLYQAYQYPLREDQKEKASLKKQENNLNIRKGYKVSDFTIELPRRRLAKGVAKQTRKINEKVVNLVDNLFQEYIRALGRYGSTMEKIKFAVEYLKEVEKDETLFRQERFKEFLSSQLVSNFLYVLRAFGFKIEVPKGLEMKDVSKKVKKEKKVRTYREPAWEREGFMSKDEWKELERWTGDAVKRDIEEGKIKI